MTPTPLVLHYAPDNASLIVRLALEQLRLPYETRLIDRAAAEQTSAAYRQLNPAGLIPVLETADGPILRPARSCFGSRTPITRSHPRRSIPTELPF